MNDKRRGTPFRLHAQPINDETVLSTGLVSKMLKVAPRTVSKWVDSGKIKGAYRIPNAHGDEGGDRRIPLGAIREFCRKYNVPCPREWREVTRAVVVGSLPVPAVENGLQVVRAANTIQAYQLVTDGPAHSVLIIDAGEVGREAAVDLALAVPPAFPTPVILLHDDHNIEDFTRCDDKARPVQLTHKPYPWPLLLAGSKEASK